MAVSVPPAAMNDAEAGNSSPQASKNSAEQPVNGVVESECKTNGFPESPEADVFAEAAAEAAASPSPETAALATEAAKGTKGEVTAASAAAAEASPRNNSPGVMGSMREQACDRGEKGHQLRDFHSLPEYLRDNEYILRHYRVNLPLKQTLLSLFRVHNETGNIWTHLLGFVFFVILTMYSASCIPTIVELPFPHTANVTAFSQHLRDSLSSSLSDFTHSFPSHLEVPNLERVAAAVTSLHVAERISHMYNSLPHMPHIPGLPLPHLPRLRDIGLKDLHLPHLHVPERVQAVQAAAGAYLAGLREGLRDGLQDAARGFRGAADGIRESFRDGMVRLDLLQQQLLQQQVESLQQLQQMVQGLEQQVQSRLRDVELPQLKTVMSLLRYYSCVIEAVLLPTASRQHMGAEVGPHFGAAASASAAAAAAAARNSENGESASSAARGDDRSLHNGMCSASLADVFLHNVSWEFSGNLWALDKLSEGSNKNSTFHPPFDLSSPCPAPLLYANPVSRWPFFLFLAGAMVCLLCSTVCHLLACQSQEISCLVWRFDYAGIAALISTSFFPPVYYAFLCQPLVRNVYLALVLTLGVCTVAVSLHPVFQTTQFRALRASLFFGMGASGIVPCVHKLLYHFNEPVAVTTTLLELLMGALYGVGALFYATRIPERWMPGKFDIAGHSHQIFHVLVIAGAYTHYRTGLLYLQWRDVNGCM